MERIDVLWAIEEIKQLKARYIRLVDAGAWAEWADLLTDDCGFEPPERTFADRVDSTWTPLHGRDAIVAYVSELFSAGVSVHQAFAPEIEIIDPDTARGTWAMSDYIERPYAHKRSYGYYHEEYRRGSDGRWRISRLRGTRLRVDDLRE